MNIRDTLNLRYMKDLTATAAGRAHILRQLADAESTGESAIFDRVLARVTDPPLARMIEKHRSDEIRHEIMFRKCLARTHQSEEQTPDHLRVIRRLDEKLGHLLDRPIRDARDITEAYLVLQVLEERAVHEFAFLERAFRDVDPETADTLALVLKDERRHLLYCQAIARRYTPDDEQRAAMLQRIRRLEAEAYLENRRANMQHVRERRIIRRESRRLFWRALEALMPGAALPFTDFAGPQVAQQAA